MTEPVQEMIAILTILREDTTRLAEKQDDLIRAIRNIGPKTIQTAVSAGATAGISNLNLNQLAEELKISLWTTEQTLEISNKILNDVGGAGKKINLYKITIIFFGCIIISMVIGGYSVHKIQVVDRIEKKIDPLISSSEKLAFLTAQLQEQLNTLISVQSRPVPPTKR